MDHCDRILRENWKREGLDTSLKEVWKTGSISQRHESDRLKHARTEENVATMDGNCTVSLKDQTQTHHSTCTIFRETV